MTVDDETVGLLKTLVRAMVTDKGAVEVTVSPLAGDVLLFSIKVGSKDKGKVIGKQGRTARSLRVILNTIAKEHDRRYALDVDGSTVAPKDAGTL